jgi:uncharacterized damage-inducible protein DinB
MNSCEVIVDGFHRIRDEVHGILDGLGRADLVARLDPQANTIGWLVWHLTRVQDDHVAAVADRGQVWHDGGWVDRFGLPFDPNAIGYGQSSVEVGQVEPESAGLLADYHDAVHDRTCEYLGSLGDRDLERVVDDSWDPPVTLGVRLVSVLSDDLQHVGQAAFIRGVLERARG